MKGQLRRFREWSSRPCFLREHAKQYDNGRQMGDAEWAEARERAIWEQTVMPAPSPPLEWYIGNYCLAGEAPVPVLGAVICEDFDKRHWTTAPA